MSEKAPPKNLQSPHPKLIQDVPALRYYKGVLEQKEIPVAREVPYTLFVNDREVLSIATLPSNLRELFIGFLVSEGVLLSPDEIEDCFVDHGNKLVVVELDVPDERMQRIHRKGMLTSGCAGGMVFSVETEAESSAASQTRRSSSPKFSCKSIVGRMHELDTHQGIYRTTRGVHGAAAASSSELLIIMEDLGRHNAVDKIVGHCFLNGMDTSDKLLLTTGRITSEVLSKASRGGFPIIVSRSSASAMALQMAKQCSIDVATYVRAGRFNFFSSDRVELVAE
ncbi:formate dehydrogenase accessory sulfurtransferase FdhD [Thermodesulfobacteriota bacterium]